MEGAAQICGAALEKKFHVADCFLIRLRSGQILDTWAEAALDVVLEAGTRMKARQVNLAGRNQKIAMDEIDNPVSQIGREVWTVVEAAVLAEAAGHVDARPALAQRELHVGIGLVVAQQDIEARLTLFDEIVLEGQSLFIVRDHDVVNVDGLADQSAGL